MQPIAISLFPDEALLFAIAEHTIVLSTTPQKKRKIIFHTAAYNTLEDEKIGNEAITQLTFEPGEIPINSFIGWAKITEIKEYNAQTFAIDSGKHGHGTDINKFLGEEDWQGRNLYGYLLEEQHFLSLPVMGVGSEFIHGDIWEAQSPFHIVAMERALNGNSVDVVTVKF